MERIDYLNDPAAPKPTSIAPGVNVAVTDDRGRLLLIRRSDNGNWALPGGAVDLGESVRQAAVRETREETGIEVEVTGLVGIYTDPGHVMEYPEIGVVRQQFAIVLTGRQTGGRLTPSPESPEVAWVDPADLDALPIHPSMRQRIDHHLAARPDPYIS